RPAVTAGLGGVGGSHPCSTATARRALPGGVVGVAVAVVAGAGGPADPGHSDDVTAGAAGAEAAVAGPGHPTAAAAVGEQEDALGRIAELAPPAVGAGVAIGRVGGLRCPAGPASTDDDRDAGAVLLAQLDQVDQAPRDRSAATRGTAGGSDPGRRFAPGRSTATGADHRHRGNGGVLRNLPELIGRHQRGERRQCLREAGDQAVDVHRYGQTVMKIAPLPPSPPAPEAVEVVSSAAPPPPPPPAGNPPLPPEPATPADSVEAPPPPPVEMQSLPELVPSWPLAPEPTPPRVIAVPP